VTIHTYATAGCGLFDPVARNAINDRLAQGLCCAHAWECDD